VQSVLQIFVALKEPHSLIPQFLKHFRSWLSWCGALFSSIPHRISVSISPVTTFLSEQRSSLCEDSILWFPFFPIFCVIVAIGFLAVSLIQIANTTELEDDDATSVPTFYAPPLGSSGDADALMFLTALPLVAVVFGALHLIAWQFHFPSHVEQLLWRIGSLVITAIPAVPLVVEIILVILFIVGVIIFFFINFILDVVGPTLTHFLKLVKERLPSLTPFLKSFKERLSLFIPESVKKILRTVVEIIFGIAEIITSLISFLFFVSVVVVVFVLTVPLSVAAVAALVGFAAGLVGYMFARLLLLTQAVVLLREQPESAFYEISWIRFWPHI